MVIQVSTPERSPRCRRSVVYNKLCLGLIASLAVVDLEVLKVQLYDLPRLAGQKGCLLIHPTASILIECHRGQEFPFPVDLVRIMPLRAMDGILDGSTPRDSRFTWLLLFA